MTLGEITKIIEAYEKRTKNRLKEKALMDYKLSQCIAANVANVLDKENRIPEFFEFYKEIFEEENNELEKKKKNNELEMQKQRMKDFANFHNKKFRRKE